ncbi:glutathione S-transferase T3-like [Humulus lupulus]|uniref:glutathione S-transferase T3-like n=1 Tax=Humulus lupulus TaxID=3486 RepID=UPI002B40B760|nr:glutathione S-transferase T3-like [Humulus lupulus]
MVSRNYKPSLENSSIDLNRETSSTPVFETQPEHDDIVGNDQTSTHFWARIAEYNTNQKCEKARTGRQYKDHWSKVNQNVARFNECYKRVKQTHHSGWSDEKNLENAHQLYKSQNKNSIFLLVDCWRLLKDEPKWNTMYQPKRGKRTKVSESRAFTSSSNADISDDEVREVRPTGQKAAKRKGKEKKTHTRFIDISERKASAFGEIGDDKGERGRR